VEEGEPQAEALEAEDPEEEDLLQHHPQRVPTPLINR
jgi:hypothetical protein